jgi:hypothetical protein
MFSAYCPVNQRHYSGWPSALYEVKNAAMAGYAASYSWALVTKGKAGWATAGPGRTCWAPR